AQIAGPARHEVQEATGCRDRDVCAAAQRDLLIAVADASVQRDDAGRAVAAEGLELGGDLRAKLAGGHDDKRERRRGATVDPLEDRESEGARFPCAGLRLREEIAPGTKVWDGEVLDRREARPTEVTRRTIEVRSKRDQERGVLPWATKKADREAARHMSLVGAGVFT